MSLPNPTIDVCVNFVFVVFNIVSHSVILADQLWSLQCLVMKCSSKNEALVGNRRHNH